MPPWKEKDWAFVCFSVIENLLSDPVSECYLLCEIL